MLNFGRHLFDLFNSLMGIPEATFSLCQLTPSLHYFTFLNCLTGHHPEFSLRGFLINSHPSKLYPRSDHYYYFGLLILFSQSIFRFPFIFLELNQSKPMNLGLPIFFRLHVLDSALYLNFSNFNLGICLSYCFYLGSWRN